MFKLVRLRSIDSSCSQCSNAESSLPWGLVLLLNWLTRQWNSGGPLLISRLQILLPPEAERCHEWTLLIDPTRRFGVDIPKAGKIHQVKVVRLSIVVKIAGVLVVHTVVISAHQPTSVSASVSDELECSPVRVVKTDFLTLISLLAWF